MNQLEAEARFVAKHAKHNLRQIRKNPDMIISGKYSEVVNDLKFMIKLNKSFIHQSKKDRHLGQLRPISRLIYLIKKQSSGVEAGRL